MGDGLYVESAHWIRPAGAADVPAIVAMGQRFLREVYAGCLEESPPHLQAFAERLVAQEDTALLVATLGGRPVGMIAAYLYEHPFSGDRVCSELVWWVEPEHRGQGVRLLRAAEAWGRAKGAHRMHMIAPSEPVATLYERLGYRLLERTYDKEFER